MIGFGGEERARQLGQAVEQKSSKGNRKFLDVHKEAENALK